MSQYYNLYHTCRAEQRRTAADILRSYDGCGGIMPLDSDCPCFLPIVPLPALAITTPAEGQMLTSLTQVIGTAIPCATVAVYLDDILLGYACADEDGNWTIPNTAVLVEGMHQVRAISCDACCIPAIVSNSFIISAGALTAPTISTPVASIPETTTLPTATGFATPGNTVVVCFDGTDCQSVIASLPNGYWSATATQALVNGTHTVTAYQTDGLTQSPIASTTFVVSAAASAAPAINTIPAGAVTISGTGAAAGCLITVTYPNGTTATTTVVAGGTWSIAVPSGITLVSGNVVSATQQCSGQAVSTSTSVFVS